MNKLPEDRDFIHFVHCSMSKICLYINNICYYVCWVNKGTNKLPIIWIHYVFNCWVPMFNEKTENLRYIMTDKMVNVSIPFPKRWFACVKLTYVCYGWHTHTYGWQKGTDSDLIGKGLQVTLIMLHVSCGIPRQMLLLPPPVLTMLLCVCGTHLR